MTVSRPFVVTVLPTYNERENIRPLIERTLESATTPHMVLVVDDDSPDGTWQEVEEIAAERNLDDILRVALIRRTQEKGLTSAIQLGIDEALHTYDADVVTWMDCDLSMPPEDISKLVDAVTEGADLAVGSRWIPGGADIAHGFMARTLSRVINTYAIALLGSNIHDYTSGFIAGRPEVFAQIRLTGDYGEYCIDLLGRAQQSGFRVVEVPYTCVPRQAGDSKTGATLWDYLVKGRKYVATVWKVSKNNGS